MDSSRIVLIVPVYNKPELTRACLMSIIDAAPVNPAAEILVVDDGSDGVTRDMLARLPVTVLTNERNCGYLATTNRGLRHALDNMQADFVVLLNNDLIVRDDWLGRLLSAMTHYDVTGYSNAGKKWLWRRHPHRATRFLEGSCMMIGRGVLERIGLLDPSFVKGYYSDDDLCLRALLAGYTLGLVDHRRFHYVRHRGGQTFGTRKFDYMRQDFDTFVGKWRGRANEALVGDYLRRWTFNPHHWSFRLLEGVLRRLSALLVDSRAA